MIQKLRPYIDSLLRRADSLQTVLIVAAFWTLAVIALAGIRDLHLWGMPWVVGSIARATMACVVVLTGLVGVRCLFAWRQSGLRVSVTDALGGMPGMLLLGAVASYLAIGIAVMDEANWQPDTTARLRYLVLCFGVLAAAAVGGTAMLERVGAKRLLQGVLVILIASCAVILASPVLRELGILAPYRISFRLTGAFSSPNHAGLVTTMTVALAVAFLTNGTSRKLGWTGLAMGAAATLSTASRTAFLVLVTILVLFALLNLRDKRKTVFLLSGVGGLIGVAVVVVQIAPWKWLRDAGNKEGMVFCESPAKAPSSADADCAVLLAVKEVLAGDMTLNWSLVRPVQLWEGVTVEGPEKRVTALRLGRMALNGRLPLELGRLSGLVHLNLSRNRLTGPIPPELGNLTNLKYLTLAFNRLTGTIPPELAEIPGLEQLWLRNNHLTGPVPPQLAEVDSLRRLRLAGNDLDHPIPSGLYDLDLDFANELFCRRSPRMNPELLGDCTLLLAIRDEFAGQETLNWNADVPIGRWQGVVLGGPEGRVRKLHLSQRGLTGRLPPELGRLRGLVSLHLARNRLTGPVPPELEQLADLRELTLGGNALTGPVPPRLYELRNHDVADDLFCRRSSRMNPELLGDCNRLLAMRDELAGQATLNWNGDVPIGRWQGVVLGGPEGRVRELHLSRKGLTGRLPPELGRLRGLVSLHLARNRLTGPIPPELGQLGNLRELVLDLNALTGVIPSELGRLTGLSSLWLGSNQLTGPPPAELLDVASHDLFDRVFCLPPPRTRPGLFRDCTTLLAARETLEGDARLNWHEAVEIRKWQGITLGGPEGRVIALELPRMGLNGRIPATLGSLDRLRSLVLDGNGLTGSIPRELGNLADLQELGLAANDLTGSVPTELARPPSLDEVWLNDNRLTGPVPFGLGPVGGHAPVCAATPPDNPGLRGDCALLLAVKDTLAGDARLNWSAHLPLAAWHGVTVGGPLGRVTKLELPRWKLNGRIPPELGRVGHLVSLDLSGNRLAGGIPSALGELRRLAALRLDRNRLTGPVPPELGKLQRLKELRLEKNGLTGPVPPQLGEIDALSVLRLSGNGLERPFPPQLHEIEKNDLHVLPAHQAEVLGNVDGPEMESNVVCHPSPAMTPGLLADCTLLLAIKDALAGEARLNWNGNLPLAFWQGVSVGGSTRRVTALELPRAGLNGRLVAELGDLGGLVALDLRHNRLAGPVPSTLGNLEQMVSLRLEHNELAGSVPPELGALDNLSFLRLSGNDLVRPFPTTLHAVEDHDLGAAMSCRSGRGASGLPADCALLLAVKSELAGDAPLNWSPDVPLEDWQGVTANGLRGRVTALDLMQMGLNGRLPPEMGRLDGLVSLRLSRNRLSGPIPPEFGGLSNLRELWLDENRLSGPVPPELDKLSGLEDLRLRKNALGEPLPSSMAPPRALATLRFDGDEASTGDRGGGAGESPRCRAAATRLYDDCSTLLDVRDTLAGDTELNWSPTVPIDHWRGVTLGFPPAAVGATAPAPRIVALDLSHMGLSGSIPAELSALDALAVLHLGDNRLEGPIPPELGALAGLRTLALENNALTGTIPEEIGALRRLVWLRLGGNDLDGPVPRQIGDLADLRVLSLEDNALTGSVPGGLRKLKHLESLRLENNRLRGRIPWWLVELPRLATLRLENNAFHGCIPLTWRTARARYDSVEPDLLCRPPPWRKPRRFEDAARLMPVRDALAGDATLNWSYANPVGSWQGVTLGRSGEIAGLDLRGMSLSGRIPPELGELSGLEWLLLDDNRLTGPIPPELGMLTRLTMLSLDGNRLHGPVPPELGDLFNLHELWLADNRLTGSVPPELGETSLRSVAVAGNDFNDGCLPWQLRRLPHFDSEGSLVCSTLGFERLLLWKLGFEKAMEAPVLGHGLMALEHLEGAPVTPTGKLANSHNLYLALLGEAGVVPLLLFVSAIVLLLRMQRTSSHRLIRDTTTAWCVVIVLFGMTFSHWLASEAFMFLAGLSVAIGTARNDSDGRLPKA